MTYVDVVAFVTARLDEEETAAKERRGIWPRPCVEDNGAVWLHIKRGGNAGVVHYAHPVEGYDDMADLRRWAIDESSDDSSGWHSDRVLRGIAVKRTILKQYTDSLTLLAVRESFDLVRSAAGALRVVVELMAGEWDTHPHYQARWKH